MTWLCTSSNWSEYPEQKVVPSKASNLSNMQRSYSRFVDEIFFDMFRLIRWFAVESIEYGPLRNASQLSVSHVPCCLNLVFDQPLFGPTVPQCGGHGRAGGHRPRALAGASARLRLKPLGRTCASPCWWVFQKGIPFFRRQHVWRIYICLQMFDMSEIRLVPLGGSFLFHVIRYNVVTLIWIWVLNEAGCKELCPLSWGDTETDAIHGW